MIRFIPLILFLATPANAESYTCKFVSALDGDTIRVTCPQNMEFDREKTVRVWALDTPEKRLGLPGKVSKGTAKCAKEAKLGRLASAWSQAQFNAGDDVTFTPVDTKQKDPYGRIIAKVQLKSGKDWADEAIRLGYGAHYDPADDTGYTKPDWCK